jgi:fermentation-respiration switch protein FrsA (DUF1100 family)
MKIRRIVDILFGLYFVALIGLFTFQRSFLYFPNHFNTLVSNAHTHKPFQELPVKTADGLKLTAWYAPATSKPFTIIFFHGNGDSLYSASPVADPYTDAGYGFLLVEYRGYSGLPGKPSEAGLYADGRACIHALMERGVKSENILLFGHSLGTGIAVQMAEEFPVGGVMLLAPYLSIAKMAQMDFPIFPAKWIVLDRYDNEKKIAKVHVPVLIVNGANDRVIPPSQGKQLYELANEPRKFDSLPDCGHNNAFDEFAVISLDWITRLK